MKKKKGKEPTAPPGTVSSTITGPYEIAGTYEISPKISVLKCAHCGTLNPIDVIRCIHCNASLKDVKPTYERKE
jgi:hypothetical protein